MTVSRIAIFVCFIVLLVVPLLFRPEQTGSAARGENVQQLIIITPHNEQIRYEFGKAFHAWHLRNYGQHVNVVFNVPGGTSEIRKMLESQFIAAFESNKQPGGDADLVFGGGSFEHGRLKRGVRVVVDGIERQEPITAPAGFSERWLEQTYGENRIGDGQLHDPDQYWFGTALSGFGIVFNNDVLRAIDVPQPNRWIDLCNPKLQGWVALVNPGQSGSVTTAFESILKRSGWEEGWRILRRAGANSRYFSGSSLKPPIDVSQGNAAMGICIDFFGRYQAQAMKDAGDGDRIGYIDPIGGSTIDADPISMLRNAPNPELAKRFIEFCLSDEGQALWQFPRAKAEVSDDAADVAIMGPDRFELRRMPITRSMYAKHASHFIDQVDPYEFATPVEYPDSNFRDFIAPMFAAMVMDNHHELKEAWKAITTHPAFPPDGMIRSRNITDATLRKMLDLFDAMPSVNGPGAAEYSLENPSQLGAVRAGWLRGQWSNERLWHAESSPADEMRKQFGAFFRSNYRRIVQLAEESRRTNKLAVN